MTGTPEQKAALQEGINSEKVSDKKLKAWCQVHKVDDKAMRAILVQSPLLRARIMGVLEKNFSKSGKREIDRSQRTMSVIADVRKSFYDRISRESVNFFTGCFRKADTAMARALGAPKKMGLA